MKRSSLPCTWIVFDEQCSDLLYEVHRSHRWKVHRNHRNTSRSEIRALGGSAQQNAAGGATKRRPCTPALTQLPWDP
jgi:hypothetical protein